MLKTTLAKLNKRISNLQQLRDSKANSIKTILKLDLNSLSFKQQNENEVLMLKLSKSLQIVELKIRKLSIVIGSIEGIMKY